MVELTGEQRAVADRDPDRVVALGGRRAGLTSSSEIREASAGVMVDSLERGERPMRSSCGGFGYDPPCVVGGGCVTARAGVLS